MPSAKRDFRWGARTHVMGIVNVTPDSFSGDGLLGRPEVALAQAVAMEAEGADVIDVGGMSTRPGHVEVGADEEAQRVMSVLPGIVARVEVPVSVDAFRLEVALPAVEAGATVINDVWGLRRDPRLAELAAERGTWLLLMHNREKAEYADVMSEVLDDLRWSIETAERAGVARDRLVVDPGIGFGKTWEHNLVVLRRLGELRGLGLPVLLGTSRKSFIGKILGTEPAERFEGTAASVALGIAAGVDMVRVHEVAAVARVCRVADAIVRGVVDPGATG